MLPNSFYGFDDAAVRERIGKWHDASPESRLRIGKRNRAATSSASSRIAGQAVSCAVAAKATKPADPSATQPTKFDLIANCTIAKALISKFGRSSPAPSPLGAVISERIAPLHWR